MEQAYFGLEEGGGCDIGVFREVGWKRIFG